MVVRVGSPATISCELRQARKGAAVTANSGARVWLAWAATLLREAKGVRHEADLRAVIGVRREAEFERSLRVRHNRQVHSSHFESASKRPNIPPASRNR